MAAIQDIELNASQPAEKSCADCRFGAGFPQGPQRLMRCVNPGHPTVGQFLKDPVACEGFQARAAAASKSGPSSWRPPGLAAATASMPTCSPSRRPVPAATPFSATGVPCAASTRRSAPRSRHV